MCITPTQLTWLARKTPSKGCAATPGSKVQINLKAAIFNPTCSINADAPFVHYLRVDVPGTMVFKDGPTGKFVTFYGVRSTSGFQTSRPKR